MEGKGNEHLKLLTICPRGKTGGGTLGKSTRKQLGLERRSGVVGSLGCCNSQRP